MKTDEIDGRFFLSTFIITVTSLRVQGVPLSIQQTFVAYLMDYKSHGVYEIFYVECHGSLLNISRKTLRIHLIK